MTGVLVAAGAWLQRPNRFIVIVLGVVFGTWLLVKALDGLGII